MRSRYGINVLQGMVTPHPLCADNPNPNTFCPTPLQILEDGLACRNHGGSACHRPGIGKLEILLSKNASLGGASAPLLPQLDTCTHRTEHTVLLGHCKDRDSFLCLFQVT